MAAALSFEARNRLTAQMRIARCRTCGGEVQAPVTGKPRFMLVMGMWLCGVVMDHTHSSGWQSGFGGWPERVTKTTWTEGVGAGRTMQEAWDNWRAEVVRIRSYDVPGEKANP